MNEFSLKRIEDSAKEPIILQEEDLEDGELAAEGAKNFLRIVGDYDDNLIQSFIKAVRIICENNQRRAYITQKWRLTLDDFPCRKFIRIPRPPLQSIETFSYIDTDGNEVEVDTDIYDIDTDGEPGRLYLKYSQQWPTTTLENKSAVKIEFTAGYGDNPEDVPETVIQAMRLLLGEWYEMREAVVVGNVVNELPFGVKMLLNSDGIPPFHPAGE